MMFQKEFSFTLYGQVYNAYVEGVIENDKFDRGVIYSLIDTVMVEDSDGNIIDESHDDWEDIMNEVESRDYQPDNIW